MADETTDRPPPKRRSPRGLYQREGKRGYWASITTNEGKRALIMFGLTRAKAAVRFGEAQALRAEGKLDEEALDSFRMSRRHKAQGPTRHPTLETAWADWEAARGSKRSFDDDRRRWEVLSSFLPPSTQLRKLTARRVDEALSALRADRGVKEATINRYRALLRSVLKLAAERTEVGFDPKSIRTTREAPRSRVITDEELAAVLTRAEEEAGTIEARREKKRQRPSQRALWLRELALALRLGLMTSSRRGEIGALTWGQVDLVHGALHFGMTKSGGGRTIPLSREAGAALEAWRAVVQRHGHPTGSSDFVFVTKPDSIGKRFSREARELGIVDVRFHDVRRTAASRMLDAGIDARTVQSLTGHRDLGVLLRVYRSETEARRREAAEILSGAFGGES